MIDLEGCEKNDVIFMNMILIFDLKIVYYYYVIMIILCFLNIVFIYKVVLLKYFFKFYLNR